MLPVYALSIPASKLVFLTFQKKLAFATFIFVRTWAMYHGIRHGILQLTLAFSLDNVYVNLQTQRWKIFYKFVCHHSTSLLLHCCSCSSTHGDLCNVGKTQQQKRTLRVIRVRTRTVGIRSSATANKKTSTHYICMMMMAGRIRKIHHVESYRYRHNKTCQCCTYYISP